MKVYSQLVLVALLAVASAAAWSAAVNLNTADAATLAHSLKGIGSAKAQAIVEYRQKHGPFRSVEELTQVKGISQKLIDRNRADLRIDRVAGAPAASPPGAAPRPALH